MMFKPNSRQYLSVSIEHNTSKLLKGLLVAPPKGYSQKNTGYPKTLEKIFTDEQSKLKTTKYASLISNTNSIDSILSFLVRPAQ